MSPVDPHQNFLEQVLDTVGNLTEGLTTEAQKISNKLLPLLARL